MGLPLVGRAADVAAIRAVIDAALDGRTAAAVCIVEAPPGLGKTALLDTIVATVEPSVRVVACRPTASESEFAGTTLERLLHDIDLDLGIGSGSGIGSGADPGGGDPGGGGIDPVHRTALRRVVQPDAVDSADEIDARTVGQALLALVPTLADRCLLVVDDAHWADRASATALAYAIRRLDRPGAAVLLARRPDERATALDELDHLDGRTHLIRLEPLGASSVDDLVARVAPQLSARRRRRIVHAAAGSPLFAIELARSAPVEDDLDDAMPLPPSIGASIAARLAELDDATLDALRLVALSRTPTRALVRRLGVESHVDAAERAGWLRTGIGTIDFVHPLHAAAVLDRSAPGERRAAHRRLASATDHAVDRMRHLARAADDVDPATAAELARAADDASVAGLVEQAAELALFAVRLTPSGDPPWPDRVIAAARLAFRCGESDLARRLFDELDAATIDTRQRVRHLVARLKLEFSVSEVAARDTGLRALALCESDAERVEVHALLSRASYEDFAEAARHATAAHQLSLGLDLDDDTRLSLMVGRATAQLMIGQGLDHDLFAEALRLEGGRFEFAHESVEGTYAALLKVTDDLDEGRARLLALLDRDDEGARPYVLSHLPQLEVLAGNWDLAEDYANQHLDAALRTGQHEQEAQARNNVAYVDLHRGDLDGARQIALALREQGRDEHSAWTERSAEGLLGLVAIAAGDAPGAVEHLERWEELGAAMHLWEPGYRRLRGDLVEALVACGRVDEARRHAEEMTEDAARLGRASLRGIARRVTALVAAADGERDTSITAAHEAVETLAATPMVLEHARALLTCGQIHRRFKEKAAARQALGEALAVFERLGAEPLAARARLDLDRVGLRTTSSTALTETERRVADLAATGRTVRQVADELFISPKTVEANLTRVYRKLAITGRVELATWVARQTT